MNGETNVSAAKKTSSNSKSKYAVEKAECIKNIKCGTLGLKTGNCCPTATTSGSKGEMLACCDNVGTPNDSSTQKSAVAAAAAGSDDDVAPITDEWKSLLFIDQAIVMRDEALKGILAMSNFGNGNSKSNAIMWAISRPASSQNKEYIGEPHKMEYIIPKECSKNSACVASGLHGNCCPAPDGWNEWGHYNGTSLGCCPKKVVAWGTVVNADS
jgi:hypothetical protein